MRDHADQVRLFARELGLSPAARANLRITPGPDGAGLEAELEPRARLRVVPDTPGQEIFIISSKAQMQRITLEDVRVTGRNTQGVIVWREREADDFVAAIACFHESERKLSDNGDDDTSNGSTRGSSTRTSGAVASDTDTPDIEASDTETPGIDAPDTEMPENGSSNGHRTDDGNSDEK